MAAIKWEQGHISPRIPFEWEDDLAILPWSEYGQMQARIKELEAFRKHIEEEGGCMCERIEGESQKDCEICWPR